MLLGHASEQEASSHWQHLLQVSVVAIFLLFPTFSKDGNYSSRSLINNYMPFKDCGLFCGKKPTADVFPLPTELLSHLNKDNLQLNWLYIEHLLWHSKALKFGLLNSLWLLLFTIGHSYKRDKYIYNHSTTLVNL